MATIPEDTKVCAKCGCEQHVSQFPLKKAGDKRYATKSCRSCINKAQNRRYAKLPGQQAGQDLRARNAELEKQGKRECVACSQTLDLAAFRLKDGHRARKCSGCQNAVLRENYAENRGGIREYLREHGRKRRERHGDRLNAEKREYVAANRQKVTDRQNRWAKEKLKEDEMFALKKRLRSLMSNAFRSVAIAKSAETEAILGCSFEAFKAHIESQFLSGMTWANREQWHLDHIVPLATAVTAEDVVRLNHFTNYRPLWAADNIAKGAKLDWKPTAYGMEQGKQRSPRVRPEVAEVAALHLGS
jgi:hypothetical protein